MKLFEVMEKSWTAETVVRDILGSLVTTDESELLNRKARYMLSRSWSQTGPLFTGFVDDEYGRTGMIGLRSLSGSTPADIAEAAHEAFHAIMHERGFTEPHDEMQVNNMAKTWCRKNLSGSCLQQALIRMQVSIDSYVKK